jgi:hypothetical protein
MRLFPVYLVALTLAILTATAALADVANRYAGQVLIFNRRPPSSWRSDGVFHNFVRQYKTTRVQQREDGNWDVEYMAFFRGPVGDREVTIRFFDAADRSSRYVASYTLYLQDPRQRIVGGRARLERPDFQPNRQYRVAVANRGRTLAKLRSVALIGQEPERSGEVNFSIEETRGR